MNLSAAAKLPRHFTGSSKVFVSDVVAAGLATKDELLAAHRVGKIELSRCDLTSVADRVKVAASEIRYLNAEFHLVRVGQ